MTVKTFLSQLAITGVLIIFSTVSANAVETIRVEPEVAAINVLPLAEKHRSEGDDIQISTAAGSDGIVRRIAVKAKVEGRHPDWIVFALRNDTNQAISRWLVAPHFRMIGSGLLEPDLGATRITDITASKGEAPERQNFSDADIFEILIEPGETITYVAELASLALPQLYLWNPESYKDKLNGLTFFSGAIAGIAALLAIFLTILFLVKGTLVFPSAAAFAWAVLAYVSIDFGILGKTLSITAEGERVYRAGADAMLAAALVVFLFSYLNLNRWHVRYGYIAAIWLAILGGLIVLAVIDPEMASGVARLSIGVTVALGLLLIIYLATHSNGRAMLLLPTWFILFIWVAAAGFALLGYLQNDIAANALIGGLVLIVMLISFTVLQQFISSNSLTDREIPDLARRALALVGSGDIVFDWSVKNNRVLIGSDAETALGYPKDSLQGDPEHFMGRLVATDKDRFQTAIDGIIHHRQGRIATELRFKASDGNHHWFRLRARPIADRAGDVSRILGTLTDITETKITEERILHDAIHDSLTGLANRRLLLDRLDVLLKISVAGVPIRPTVIAIDIDRFRDANAAIGLSGGDGLLLAITRRLARFLQPQDSLARIGADRFVVLLLSETEPAPITAFVDAVRRSFSSPISIDERSVFVTASIGISLPEPNNGTRAEILLRNAEIAMMHAKRLGGDRIDVFRPAMRAQGSERLAFEADLAKAVEDNQIRLEYRPVIRLRDRAIVGFEANTRWNRKGFGLIDQHEIFNNCESIDLGQSIGLYIFNIVINDLCRFQKSSSVWRNFFMTVSIPTNLMRESTFIQEIKTIVNKAQPLPDTLRFEFSEGYLIENPEQNLQMLTSLSELGVGLIIGDFGHGYASLGLLDRFPIGTIRVTRNMTQPNLGGARPALVRAVVALAQDLEISIITDGIDTESEAVEFDQIGFDMGTGSLFSDVMTANDIERLISRADR
ncbi:MAG: EAL domain-containing protein [Hyphomicrobiales bacterium]